MSNIELNKMNLSKLLHCNLFALHIALDEFKQNGQFCELHTAPPKRADSKLGIQNPQKI